MIGKTSPVIVEPSKACPIGLSSLVSIHELVDQLIDGGEQIFFVLIVTDHSAS